MNLEQALEQDRIEREFSEQFLQLSSPPGVVLITTAYPRYGPSLAERFFRKPLQPHRDNDYPDLDVPACDPYGLMWRPDKAER